MEHAEYGEWQDLASAPRDGSRVLVLIRASEQGPAEVDVARWGRSRNGGECWIASDSDHDCAIVYSDGELACWMPLPTPLPPLRSGAQSARNAPKPAGDETFGSGI